ncbi:acetyltransferase [Thalassotalea sediminis]|uniref:acetyltransferase n=1 Tax=Thalassotalea sediminis TaxID=1759089 RepID=UPI00257297A0|nr:acetyltransferase [Thalassotalea sediminis]
MTNTAVKNFKDIVIYGTGKTASVLSSYINATSSLQIAAYTVEREFLVESSFLGKPVVALDEFQRQFPASDYEVIIAAGYHKMNDFRTELFEQLKAQGYNFARYIHPSVTLFDDTEIGQGCVILDNVSIQPGAKISDNTFVWSNAVIAHGSKIGKHNWITAGTVVAGDAVVGNKCFLGVNSTVGHNVILEDYTFVGANTLVAKNSKVGDVIISKDGECIRLNSHQFMKFSKI